MKFPKTTHNSATADNDVATVTISPGDSEAVYITHISAYFDNSASDIAITIKDDETEVWHGVVSNENGEEWSFNIPLKMTAGNDAVIELAASGTGGTSGVLHTWHFTGE